MHGGWGWGTTTTAYVCTGQSNENHSPIEMSPRVKRTTIKKLTVSEGVEETGCLCAVEVIED